MKIQILSANGSKIKDIETSIFDGTIRQDIVQKIVEAEKTKQPVAPSPIAGMQTSASGNVRHLRHSWKTDRGRGMSRVPKKRMSDKGARFLWVGAVIPGTRGGRRAHPPKILSKEKKINKKEMVNGWTAALAMVANKNLVKNNYNSLKDKEVDVTIPLIIDSKVLDLKTKDFIVSIKKILEELQTIAIQKKSIRAGKGKLRGRKYKRNAGVLVVIGNKENKKVNSIEIRKVNELMIGDLASNGARLVIFTEEAIKDLEEKLK